MYVPNPNDLEALEFAACARLPGTSDDDKCKGMDGSR
jgi:hypothetical protein